MKSGKGKMLVGLLSGAAVGTALGLLFAPKKGTDTRKAITETGDNYWKGTKKGINDFSSSLSHKVDALKNKTKAGITGSKTKEAEHEAKAQIHEMKAS